MTESKYIASFECVNDRHDLKCNHWNHVVDIYDYIKNPNKYRKLSKCWRNRIANFKVDKTGSATFDEKNVKRIKKYKGICCDSTRKFLKNDLYRDIDGNNILGIAKYDKYHNLLSIEITKKPGSKPLTNYEVCKIRAKTEDGTIHANFRHDCRPTCIEKSKKIGSNEDLIITDTYYGHFQCKKKSDNCKYDVPFYRFNFIESKTARRDMNNCWKKNIPGLSVTPKGKILESESNNKLIKEQQPICCQKNEDTLRNQVPLLGRVYYQDGEIVSGELCQCKKGDYRCTKKYCAKRFEDKEWGNTELGGDYKNLSEYELCKIAPIIYPFSKNLHETGIIKKGVAPDCLDTCRNQPINNKENFGPPKYIQSYNNQGFSLLLTIGFFLLIAFVIKKN